MAVLDLKIDTSEAEALLAKLSADLAALENVRKFPLDELLSLGDRLLLDVSVQGGCTTVVASDGRLVVQVVGVLEVFAAAVAALKRYVHEVMPQQS